MSGFGSRSGLANGAAIAVIILATGAQAEPKQKHVFDIQPQSLSSALRAVGSQAGINLVFDPNVAANRSAPAIYGRMTSDRALGLLLAGSGLTVRAIDEQSSMIERASTPAAVASPAPPAAVRRVVQIEPPQQQRISYAPVTLPIEEVVVTGTRLANSFIMPTPMTVVQADQITQTAPASMAESLQQMPALNGSTISTNSGTGAGVSASNGQSLLNLRGLGPNRTLILLNGQRMGVTNVGSSVDVNIIPQNLIKRVDIVTGGASASYGSDAVAGAVNFVLDTKFKGLKLELSGGQTSRQDAENGHFAVAFGKSFGAKVRIIGSADIFRLDGIHYGLTGRDWLDHPTGAYPNPVVGGRPTTLVVEDLRSVNAGYGGTITAVQSCPTGPTGDACRALAGQQFLQGGVLAPFNTGAQAGTSFTSGGDGAVVTNGLTPDVKRESAFLHGEYDVSADLTLWLEGSHSRNFTLNHAQPSAQNLNTAYTIFEGNPYLPASVAAVFAATPGGQSFSLSRYDIDLDLGDVRSNVQVNRVGTGAYGRFGDRWSFDSTFAFQNTLQQLSIRNSILRNLYAAADAVVNPANGQIVCRSTLAGLDTGCVPLNLYGPGSISRAANDYVIGDNAADIRLRQTTFDVNVRGDLGSRLTLGAGPVSVALGASYRKLTATRTVDPLSNITTDGTGVRGFPAGLQGRYGGYQYYNPAPLSGQVTVAEGYGELGVPLLKDRPMVKSLAATLAGRLTDYSQSGLEAMWKLGLNWTLNSDVRVRGTVSADIRAPSVLELFNTAQANTGRNLLPWSGAANQIRSAGQNVVTGNPDLSPEKARTSTVGIVVSPRALPGFQTSLDYYKISIRDSILALSAQDVIDKCFFGDQEFCKSLSVNGQAVTTTNGISALDYLVATSRNVNYARESTSGMDFESAYKAAVGQGMLSLRFNGNYLFAARVQTPCIGKANLVGDIGSCGNFPKFRGRVSASYDLGAFNIYVQERYIHSGKKNINSVEGVDIGENDIPAAWYTDFNLTYKVDKTFGGRSELFLNVINLFDQDPRNTLSRPRSWIEPSELGVYDALGRRFIVGVRFKM